MQNLEIENIQLQNQTEKKEKMLNILILKQEFWIEKKIELNVYQK